MSLTTEDLEGAFAWLEACLNGDPSLSGEHAQSLAEYFEHRGGEALDAPATRRHLEWFLLERFSASRGGTPIEGFVHGEVTEDEDAHEEALAALLASLASVFEVTGTVPGEGAWVRDLAGGGEYALEEREASVALANGDLLVGRVFQVAPGLHRLSGAAGLFRDERLLAAVRSDLERARSSRRGTLRLSQADLERMFWSAGSEPEVSAPSLEESLERARDVLVAGGVDDAGCEAVFVALRDSPRDALPLLPGAEDALGEVLNRLAIESDVDLAAARTALLEVWAGFARRAAASEAVPDVRPKARPTPLDASAAIDAFDRGRAEGRDLEELFRDLERDLGLEGDDDAGDEDLAPDFPGVVEAMVEEYLWELERTAGADAARAQTGLRAFGTFGASVGVFENLSRRELLLFTSIWLPEYGELQGEADALALIDALESFCAWCTEHQEVDLKQEYDAELGDLRASLPRLVSARPWFAPSSGPQDGTLYLVQGVELDSMTLSDATGSEVRSTAEPQLLERLRPGDWLRAEIGGDGRSAVYCAYPPMSARLRPQVES
ncbi:MAG TPA: hypothetical protein VMT18_03150 [Planctomycetota bacterium]|nr:hypothetical protein [Planctomycetota bacterium]